MIFVIKKGSNVKKEVYVFLLVIDIVVFDGVIEMQFIGSDYVYYGNFYVLNFFCFCCY